MLELEGLNYLAVVVAWLINCGIGAYWYSPAGFAKKWEQLTGIDIMEIPSSEATKALVFVVISGLVQTVGLAIILNSLEVTTATNGLITGVILWAGLVAGTTVGTTFYSRRSWKFWWLNAGYFLVVMLLNSVILAIWQ